MNAGSGRTFSRVPPKNVAQQLLGLLTAKEMRLVGRTFNKVRSKVATICTAHNLAKLTA